MTTKPVEFSTQPEDDAEGFSPATEDEIPHQDVAPHLVRVQLENILHSAMFDASERNRRFLRYIVEETLAERSAWIKGYSIGISVFDRDASFDPQIDPVVRIGAGRLRRSLERYYLTDGRRAAVRISIPKGGYIPRFFMTPAARLPPFSFSGLTTTPAKLDCSIFLLPFVTLCNHETGRHFANGLSEELIVEFGRQRTLKVFTLPSIGAVSELDSVAMVKQNPARLVLSGSVRTSASSLRVIAHLVDQVDNHHIWSTSFDRSLRGLSLTKAEREIGHKIVSALLTRYHHLNASRDHGEDDPLREAI